MIRLPSAGIPRLARQAKAEAVETKNALDSEVGAFAESPKSGSKPFEPLLNLNWLEEMFTGGRKK